MEQEIERLAHCYNHERVHESLRNLTPAAGDAMGARHLGVNRCRTCHLKQCEAGQEGKHVLAGR